MVKDGSRWSGGGGRRALMVIGALVAASCIAASAQAQTGMPTIPGIEEAADVREVATTLQVLGILTVLTLAPAILIMTTSFTRIVVVLSLLRQALATIAGWQDAGHGGEEEEKNSLFSISRFLDSFSSSSERLIFASSQR